MAVSPAPSMHTQIAADLRVRIAAGDPLLGERLPSESELGVRYGVSRVTINRAVGVLRDEGLVEIERGRGTRVVAATPCVRVPSTVLDRWAAALEGGVDDERAGALAAEIRKLL